MARQITGTLEYPVGTGFTGVIEARHIKGSSTVVPQSISGIPVTDGAYDFTLENGAYQFVVKGILTEGGDTEQTVKLGLGFVSDGAAISLTELLGLSENITPAIEDYIKANAVPSGGTTGQVLSKVSDNDGDVEWATPSSGGGSSEQVQSDWNQTDPVQVDFIKNKPTIPTMPVVPTKTSDLTNDSGFLTSETNPDWNETDEGSPAFILNKPTIPTGSASSSPNNASVVRDGLLYSSSAGSMDEASNISSGFGSAGFRYLSAYLLPNKSHMEFSLSDSGAGAFFFDFTPRNYSDRSISTDFSVVGPCIKYENGVFSVGTSSTSTNTANYSRTFQESTLTSTVPEGGTFSVDLDMSTETVSVTITNGADTQTWTYSRGVEEIAFAHIHLTAVPSGNSTMSSVVNLGQLPFTYTVPDGFSNASELNYKYFGKIPVWSGSSSSVGFSTMAFSPIKNKGFWIGLCNISTDHEPAIFGGGDSRGGSALITQWEAIANSLRIASFNLAAVNNSFNVLDNTVTTTTVFQNSTNLTAIYFRFA